MPRRTGDYAVFAPYSCSRAPPTFSDATSLSTQAISLVSCQPCGSQGCGVSRASLNGQLFTHIQDTCLQGQPVPTEASLHPSRKDHLHQEDMRSPTWSPSQCSREDRCHSNNPSNNDKQTTSWLQSHGSFFKNNQPHL